MFVCVADGCIFSVIVSLCCRRVYMFRNCFCVLQTGVYVPAGLRADLSVLQRGVTGTDLRNRLH